MLALDEGIQQQWDPDPADSFSPVIAEIGWAQASPRQASSPSRIATMAMTRPATGSAQAHPKKLLSSKPTSTAAER